MNIIQQAKFSIVMQLHIECIWVFDFGPHRTWVIIYNVMNKT